MAIPIRIATHVDFDDGSHHEYEVRAPGAEDAAGLPSFWPSAVVTMDAAERVRYHQEREAKLASAELTLNTLREWAERHRDQCSGVLAELPHSERHAGWLAAVKDALAILNSRDLPPGQPVILGRN